jgi:hypothetical protein
VIPTLGTPPGPGQGPTSPHEQSEGLDYRCSHCLARRTEPFDDLLNGSPARVRPGWRPLLRAGRPEDRGADLRRPAGKMHRCHPGDPGAVPGSQRHSSPSGSTCGSGRRWCEPRSGAAIRWAAIPGTTRTWPCCRRPLRGPCSRGVTLDALACGAHNPVRAGQRAPARNHPAICTEDDRP